MTTNEDPDAYRLPFDPECTIWTKFVDLRVHDRIDYWGAARPVIEFTPFPQEERVRIRVQGPHGQDVALAPDYEGTWRAPRDEEKEAAA